MREILPAWELPMAAYFARSIAKWVVSVLFTTAGTKIHTNKGRLLFLGLYKYVITTLVLGM